MTWQIVKYPSAEAPTVISEHPKKLDATLMCVARNVGHPKDEPLYAVRPAPPAAWETMASQDVGADETTEVGSW